MPTYQYACTACDERLEAVQTFTDAPLTECPACGGTLRKVFSAVGVVFKGSGFYKTDSRDSKKAAAKAPAEGAAASTSSSDSGSGSKSDSGSKSGSGSKSDSGSGSGSTPAAAPAASSTSRTSSAPASKTA
ncbi:MAG: FmdB family transcriptional regulator [Frankiaceae bacterium]|nr:FmdB family transcriptional regulator [Frankiaceae bacterium]